MQEYCMIDRRLHVLRVLAEVGTVTADGFGAWSFPNASAGEGGHAYTAQVSDAAGNLGPATGTTPATTTVDATAPTAAPAEKKAATSTARR